MKELNKNFIQIIILKIFMNLKQIKMKMNIIIILVIKMKIKKLKPLNFKSGQDFFNLDSEAKKIKQNNSK